MTDEQIEALLTTLHDYAHSKDSGLGLPMVWGKEVVAYMVAMVRAASQPVHQHSWLTLGNGSICACGAYLVPEQYCGSLENRE